MGGAPAGDGALHVLGQRGHPEVNGPNKLVEYQRALELQQSQVAIFSASVVLVMSDDLRDLDPLKSAEFQGREEKLASMSIHPTSIHLCSMKHPTA